MFHISCLFNLNICIFCFLSSFPSLSLLTLLLKSELVLLHQSFLLLPKIQPLHYTLFFQISQQNTQNKIKYYKNKIPVTIIIVIIIIIIIIIIIFIIVK